MQPLISIELKYNDETKTYRIHTYYMQLYMQTMPKANAFNACIKRTNKHFDDIHGSKIRLRIFL